MRGLLLLYLGFWVFLGPSTGDMEHISATLLRITNIKQFASKALGSREDVYDYKIPILRVSGIYKCYEIVE